MSLLLFLFCTFLSIVSAKKSISWWWTSPSTPNDPGVDGFLNFVTNNTDIVSSVIMNCGVVTCIHNRSSVRPHAKCLNNHGIGGKITGNLSEACLRVIPELTRLGIKTELWLGEDDSYESAQYLFDHPNETAADLLTLVSNYPAIKGFNLDLESGQGTPADTSRYATFLGTVTNLLNTRTQGQVRFTADVSCSLAAFQHNSFTGNCKTLAGSGVNRIMNMRTYNAVSYEEWVYSYLAPAFIETKDQDVVGIGLGCWDYGNHSQEGSEWSVTAKSAEERICYLINQSKTVELDMFTIRQNQIKPNYGDWPQSFWIAPLRRFMTDTTCEAKIPKHTVCPIASVGPANSWRPGGTAAHCCISMSHRGNKTCNDACAKKECLSTKGMHWVALNYSHNPFTCCY